MTCFYSGIMISKSLSSFSDFHVVLINIFTGINVAVPVIWILKCFQFYSQGFNLEEIHSVYPNVVKFVIN